MHPFNSSVERAWETIVNLSPDSPSPRFQTKVLAAQSPKTLSEFLIEIDGVVETLLSCIKPSFWCQMLFLDEPTAAVDAGAKRHLWKVPGLQCVRLGFGGISKVG